MASSDPSVREIAAMLRARVASLAPELLPGGRADARRQFFEAGSVDGEPGQSLKLNLSGARQGCYTDFSAAEGDWRHSGDVLTLVQHIMCGGDKGKAVAWAKSTLGLDGLDPKRLAVIRREVAKKAEQSDAEAARATERNRKRAAAMWAGAVPIPGTPALAYLEGRGIDLKRLGKVPGSLRYLPDAWCPRRGSKHPAMIACIMGLDGSLMAVHRTWLDLSEGKGGAVRVVKLPDAKGKMRSHKQTLGTYAGGCIPLWKGACGKTLRDIDPGTPVYVSEGIEDGLSVAMARPEARIVAGVALANMGGLILPPQAGPIVFIGQNDPLDSDAVAAFERAIMRQQDAARAVQTIFPPPEYKDFNDWLCGKRMAGADA